MPVIQLEILIKADIEICFDLARSIDLHQVSTTGTHEKAIAGRTKGLIELNETVTWQATHFYIRQQLSSVISAMTRPYHFRDEQLQGPFQHIRHDHYFDESNGLVKMRDTFDFSSPFGFIGKLADRWILTDYLRGFLEKRNEVIRQTAESELWRKYIPD